MFDNGVEYREVEGFLGYRVGDDGSIWSCRKTHWFRLRAREHSARRPPRKGRYQSVVLSRNGDPRKYQRMIHHLVLEAFIGPCPKGKEARHLDGDPRNNRLDNLAWGSRAENLADMVRHGTRLRGSEKPGAKLTEEDVIAIHRLRARGLAIDGLAFLFGVSGPHVANILTGAKWRHAQPEGPDHYVI